MRNNDFSLYFENIERQIEQMIEICNKVMGVVQKGQTLLKKQTPDEIKTLWSTTTFLMKKQISEQIQRNQKESPVKLLIKLINIRDNLTC